MNPIRFHHLKAVGRSPAHAKHVLDAEALGVTTLDTTPIRIGSAVHALVLGGKAIARFDGAVRRGKAWDEFEAMHRDSIILNATEWHKATSMAAAVCKHESAMTLLGGEHEKTLIWEESGRQLRSTPDAARYNELVAELKTCATADPNLFPHQAHRMAYPGQLAMQMDGIKACGLGDPADAYIVAVESSAPYPVTVFKLTDSLIDQGRALYRSWLETFLNCERSGHWPAYTQAIVDLDIRGDDLELTFGADEPAFTEAA
jgi:hypothetical protein